jgi:dienelactone hydrolase
MAVVAVLAGALVACARGTDASAGGGTTRPAGRPATPRGGSAATSTDPPPPLTVPVGTTTVVLSDAIRGRTLPTRVHYPTTALDGGPDAPPAPGVYPLVLMAHGYRLAPEAYDPLLRAVAARGYIVAAPAFPHTAPGGDGDRRDLANQPGDLAAVADLLVSETRREGSLVPGVARPERVAAVGHSDGGLTAAALAYNELYRDTRVAAAVTLTGGASGFDGAWSVPEPPPLLAVHGSADTQNPPSATDELVATLPATVPRYVVSVTGGDHLGPYLGDTFLPEVATVIADFLDVHLQQHSELSALDRLRTDAGKAPLVLTAE